MAYKDKEKEKQWRLDNKEKKKEYNKQYNLNNKEKKKQYQKQYILDNQEKLKEYQKQYQKQYRLHNKEKNKEYNKKYRLHNKEKNKEYQKQYRLDNKEKRNLYLANRKKNDPVFKFIVNQRSRMWLALKGQYKSKSTIKLLGCSIKECWNHLEQQFQPGMTRDNYGLWHVDHIIPCASFDLKDVKQQEICFHYTNLQPLWAEDNMKKGHKLNYEVKQYNDYDSFNAHWSKTFKPEE